MNAALLLLIQQIVNGLAVGGLYALWAVGFGIVYQVLRSMHFAFGDTAILALYTGLVFILELSLPLWLALLLMFAIGAAMSMAIERWAYAPLVARGQRLYTFVAALGIAYILRNLATIGWGAQTTAYPQVIPAGIVNIGQITVSLIGFFSLGVAAAAYLAFAAFLKYSRHGQAVVAIEQDRETASLMGIPTSRLVTIVYGVSGALAVVGALLYVGRFGLVTPATGLEITLKAFVAALIGGIGRLEGAVVGGLLLGVLEALFNQYAPPVFTDSMIFGVLCVILILRPRGLLGRVELVKL